MANQKGRYCERTTFERQHLSLLDLEDLGIVKKNLNNPIYPELVEFRVEKVSHVTGESGLRAIFKDSGFRQPPDLAANAQHNFIWWSLAIASDDISSAEEHLLTSSFPHGSSAQNQPPIPEYFTSKAFQEKSAYGNFRFTFSLKELLWHYSKQFCYGQSPVLRVYETVFYKKEIQYTVVVHPRNVNLYDDCPRLPSRGDGVCGYSDGAMWWRCQAPSEASMKRFHGSVDDYKVYNVWDHVCVAFHMEPGWVLHVDWKRLFNRVNVCEVSYPQLLRHPDTPLSSNDAEDILADLRAAMGYRPKPQTM
ncbi:hypothetical protein ROHU_004981 [Labeo rohita]|uniref:Uncharacterized protein n=2 Tax=Labeo rohita TaxID=84645 RepID=A0A498NDS7_LABRO|nr:uncharacterized protein LOC127178047 [Labeo rohita]KAI2655198.1 Ubiquitin-conjugating enzyme E2 8 [Labeo rohita]RXN29546.1 hypothetical protein ROHU_005208 [Labeo rohita]RXN30385.1 hypothetical protein ROHU_004981 [Labeo rohita]